MTQQIAENFSHRDSLAERLVAVLTAIKQAVVMSIAGMSLNLGRASLATGVITGVQTGLSDVDRRERGRYGRRGERWRQVPVTRSCCLEALEGCVVARLAIDGKGAVHLGRSP